MSDAMTETEVEHLLRRQTVGRVGCHVDGLTYVVPVIFAWDQGSVYVYTTEGQKVDMMRANPRACFEVDEYEPGVGWQSVIIQGRYDELRGEDANATLSLLAARFPFSPKRSNGPDAHGDGPAPVAFRIRSEVVTGRKVVRAPERVGAATA